MRLRVRLAVSLVVASLFAAPPASTQYLFTVNTDFGGPGTGSAMNLVDPWETKVDAVTVGSDPVVRSGSGMLYVINRFGADEVQVIDAASLATSHSFSAGAGSNPQDIALVAPDDAFVSRFNSTWLYRVNPETGAVTDSVDLSPWADADGLPEMAMMALDGDNLFIQIQRLNQAGFFEPIPPSYLAVVDVSTGDLVDADASREGNQAIELTGLNPAQKMTVDADARRLYVSTIGNFGALDAGVEAIDLDALTSLGLVTTETQLGGDAGGLAIVDGGMGAVFTSNDFFFNTALVRFDLSDGSVIDSLFVTPAFVSSLVYDGAANRLYMAERDGASPGVRVFDPVAGTQLTAAPVAVGATPPIDMTLVTDAIVSVGDVTAARPPVIRAAPNPSSAQTVLFVEGGARRVEVFDIAGRLVRRLELLGPSQSVRWDLADERGRAVAAGAYLVRADGVSTFGRLVVTR